MKPEEKTTLAYFIDLAFDYLKSGHAQKKYEKDTPGGEAHLATCKWPCPAAGSGAESPVENSSLPLAYMVEEPNEESEINNLTEIEDSLDNISKNIFSCTSCPLSKERINTVPGQGHSKPLVMVIGEGPGADEDKAGKPFVGRAGQLLDKMLDSIGLSRDKNCFIANMVKCRPPGNRDPLPLELAACFPFLERQIYILKPELILCVGRIAAQSLLKKSTGINALRGEFHSFHLSKEKESHRNAIPVLCTFHPSALLRDESLKRPAWEDLKLLRSKLDSIKEE